MRNLILRNLGPATPAEIKLLTSTKELLFIFKLRPVRLSVWTSLSPRLVFHDEISSGTPGAQLDIDAL